MALTTTEKLHQDFSLALEYREPGYEDLVSNANAIMYKMRLGNQFKSFSGPTIRVRQQYNQTGTFVRYSGADFLATSRTELFNDAEFEPKLGAVSVVLTNEEILKNSGENQLEDIMVDYLEAAEVELADRVTEDIHSAGALSNQIGGLQKAIPTTTNAGTYGGISRADNAQWRTTTYDVDTDFTVNGSAETQFDKDSAQSIMRQVVIARSRNKNGPTDVYMDGNMYNAYAEAVTAIQRINDENELGKLGFSNLKFYGAGRSVDVILEGGIGSAMPDDTSYFIDKKHLCFYLHPARNFKKFGGKQMPINQDMVVQHVGFFGELVLKNPIHAAKVYDSDPSS